MNLLTLVLAGTFASLTACGTAGSNGPVTAPPLPVSSQLSARGTMTIRISHGGPASKTRKTAFISPSTTFATLFIDGATTGFRQSCQSNPTCTVNWSTTAGTHVFAALIDDSPTTSGGGSVLAEGSESVTLTAGANTVNLVLNGVPAEIVFGSEFLQPAGSAACQIIATGTNCFAVTYGIADADGNAIVYPGTYDDGGLAIASNSAINVSYSPDVGSPDTLGNDYPATEGCASGANGAFNAFYALLSPGTVAEISTAQLATYTLVYPNQSALEMLNWPAYTCTNGTISATG